MLGYFRFCSVIRNQYGRTRRNQSKPNLTDIAVLYIGSYRLTDPTKTPLIMTDFDFSNGATLVIAVCLTFNGEDLTLMAKKSAFYAKYSIDQKIKC